MKSKSFRKLLSRPRAHGRTASVYLWVCLVLLFIGGVSDLSIAIVPSGILASQRVTQSQKTPEEVEYQVKAAFIYNFMKFTEWPKEKMDPPSKTAKSESSIQHPMVIGIVGVNPFGKAFDPLLEKKIKNRELQIVMIPGLAKLARQKANRSQAIQQYFHENQEILQSCHVLFFCESEKSYVEQYIAAVRETSILTVGDMKDFVKFKGIVGFVKENNKIRFEIHLTKAEEQRLKISSQLLKLARRVVQEKDSNDK